MPPPTLLRNFSNFIFQLKVTSEFVCTIAVYMCICEQLKIIFYSEVSHFNEMLSNSIKEQWNQFFCLALSLPATYCGAENLIKELWRHDDALSECARMSFSVGTTRFNECHVFEIFQMRGENIRFQLAISIQSQLCGLLQKKAINCHSFAISDRTLKICFKWFLNWEYVNA